ncbi:MAG: HDOD domain-containing protein [Nitrospiraceae bacterium]|nr:MAG: HDOD domain-containing protein [Nitrospiraceae bacterium]
MEKVLGGDNTMKNDSLKRSVHKIPSLPTLPVIAQEILMLIDDELVPVGKLESIIENDPAISARVLSLANSAFWGITPVKTLRDAIFRIGFNTVKHLAAGVSLMTLFDDGKHGKKGYQRVFNHSVAVGFIAKLLSRNLRMAVPEEMLMNGMLHDIGILALHRYFEDSYSEVLDRAGSGQSLIEAEKTVLDFTHAEIGGWLAEEWGLPRSIIHTTLYHHEPGMSKEHTKQAAVVHLADFLTARSILCPVEKDPGYLLDPSCLSMLGISDKDMDSLVSQVQNGDLLNGLFV